MLMLERPRALRRPPPTTHQTTYIPNSIHGELHYVQHFSSESGSPLTTLGVLGIHARQQHHGPSSLIHAHDGPSTLTPFLTYPPTHTHKHRVRHAQTPADTSLLPAVLLHHPPLPHTHTCGRAVASSAACFLFLGDAPRPMRGGAAPPQHHQPNNIHTFTGTETWALMRLRGPLRGLMPPLLLAVLACGPAATSAQPCPGLAVAVSKPTRPCPSSSRRAALARRRTRPRSPPRRPSPPWTPPWTSNQGRPQRREAGGGGARHHHHHPCCHHHHPGRHQPRADVHSGKSSGWWEGRVRLSACVCVCVCVCVFVVLSCLGLWWGWDALPYL